MFLNLNNMILTHARDSFCEENGPNLADFEKNNLQSSDFYNRF
jgi:hypothetical protein